MQKEFILFLAFACVLIGHTALLSVIGIASLFTDGNLFESLTDGSVDVQSVMRLLTCMGLSSYSLLMFAPVLERLSKYLL